MIAEDKIDLGWGRYVGKCALWLVWMVIAIPSFQGMGATSMPPAARLAFAALFAGPILIWMWSVHRTLARSDEFERDLVFKGLARGSAFGVVWVAFVHVAYVVMELIGLFEPGKVAGQANLVAVMAPMAMFMCETLIQFDRMRIAKSEEL